MTPRNRKSTSWTSELVVAAPEWVENWETLIFLPFLGLTLIVAIKGISFVHCGNLESSDF